ncbi:MAG: DNA polymerase [Methanoregulaceae archaeon PtaU1.Bin059]|nr:MAG: DNA polymerase [Methanoregulaceae archaeon PtaB.Bin009]OPY39622.1 MAG: DNA polymerase [Methanoregulaceae archaeon PtaU1.Bin059]HNQ28884.1 anaerobic ribonucleoside-triphosphate reductase [Methanolinea sp.]
MPTRDTRQSTLDGVFIPSMPPVRTSDGHILEWDRQRIVRQILEETTLVSTFYGYESASEEMAQEIARLVEERIKSMNLRTLSGPLIREIMNITLLEKGMVQYRNVCTRVGTPVFDAHLIDVGRGFEAKDNANLQENAETSHKKKADKISKEQYLLQLPPHLADHHLSGDIHIHDLEYFGTRPFCIDGATHIPAVIGGRHQVIRPDAFPYDGDVHVPGDLSVLSQKGFRKVRKLTRRPVRGERLLKIRTGSGRALRVTGEHRIPVNEAGMKVVRADTLNVGDRLFSLPENREIRGEPVYSIHLLHELVTRVPPDHLGNVYVRGAGEIFSRLHEEGIKYSEISRELGVSHRKQWYSRGIMPVAVFHRLCERFDITDLSGIRIGAAGSEHDLPLELPIDPSLVRLLGYFVAEGNYNVSDGKHYNLVITENHQSSAIIADAHASLQCCATRTGGAIASTEIYGVPVTRPRAMQVYMCGKLLWLLFRYVFGVPENSVNKRLPWIVWHLDDELLAEFLSALFTGDGSVYYRPEKSDCIVNYTTSSPALRQELSLLLSSLGMKPHIVELYEEKDRTTIYRIQMNGAVNIRIFSRYARFNDDRQEHINAFLSRVKAISRNTEPEMIVSIEEVDSTGEFVYDIFLEGDGSDESHTYYAADGLLIHNCQDWDLRYFFYYGLMPDGNGTKASVAGPAKRAEVAVLHAVKALGSAQTNFAGGQGYYNFLTFLAPYFEGMDYGEIKQLMQMFVYEMTQMMVARGGQLVFSSVQLSPGVPSLWKDKPVVFQGRVWEGISGPRRTYGEFEREVRLLFKALMEVMLEGDAWGKPFSFPKPEISIEPDFMQEDQAYNEAHPDLPSYQDLYLLTFELASKFGTPYYDNQIPPYRGAGKGISCYQCCAYQFSAVADQDAEFDQKLYFQDGKHFSMGSWQVVSLNCPRAAYRAGGDNERLFSELRALMDVCVEVFRIKRRWLETIRSQGRMPFAMQRPKDPVTGERGSVAVDLDGLVYTIGVVGVNEMVQHHVGSQLHESRDAFRLAILAMTHMEQYARELSKRHNMTIALARTPAETTGQRFAVADLLNKEYRGGAMKVIKGDLEKALPRLGSTRDLPIYYTNGTHVAPGANVTMAERMSIEHVFFPIVDGGNIFHIWLGESRPNPKGLMEMAMNLCRTTQIGYFAFTRDLTVSLHQFHEYRSDRNRISEWVSAGGRIQA